MLPENVGLCLSTIATGVQARPQARTGRGDVAVQAQLPVIHRRLRPPDTREIVGRF